MAVHCTLCCIDNECLGRVLSNVYVLIFTLALQQSEIMMQKGNEDDSMM